MKFIIILLLSLLSLFSLVNSQQPLPADEFITAFPSHYSWEMIFPNTTSYLDEIDAHRNVIYVSGEGFVHEIVEDPVFEFSSRRQVFHQHRHSFIDFKVFEHRNVSHIIGPIHSQNASSQGISHPIQIGSLTDSDNAVLFSHADIQISSICVTDMYDHVVVYGVGWLVYNSERANNTIRAGLGVFRLFVHPNHTQFHNGSFISFNHTRDFVYIRDNGGYTEYTRAFKPWIFHSNHSQQVVVVDPATDLVYRLDAPNDRHEPFTLRAEYNPPASSSNITSAVYDAYRSLLVLGTRGRGILPGNIVGLDLSAPATDHNSNIKVAFTYNLNRFESNPKALHLRWNSLYVGLSGGSYVLHLDISKNPVTVAGYATLPFYIHQVHDIHVTHRHIYVITNEQFSKIARTPHHHFCATPCDSVYGYCNNGTCACHPGHVINNTYHVGRCSPAYNIIRPTNDVINSGHGGEVALGLLFAIFFVAAVLGWFVVWRSATGRSVPFGLGGNSSSRYSSVHNDEREGFLNE